ncbi:MAG: YihY/virulence factor BrkB family protein [Deltaproteobacteria bacterium]|jgi:membrane protein|nr:YihY/virulence factor BrkB family protein [Deltaproteobacteria bacterium]
MKKLVYDTFRTFSEHGGTMLGGAAAFFAVLSAAPLLLLTVAIAAPLAGSDQAREELLRALSQFVGHDSARTLAAILDNARRSDRGTLATTLGTLVVLYGSTRLFTALQHALNTMWDVRIRRVETFGHVAWWQVRKRLIAFCMVLLCGLVLLGSVLLRAGLSHARRIVPRDLSGAWWVLDHAVSVALVAGLFTLIFRLLPDVRIAWKDALAGAVVTATLFGFGRTVVGYYLGQKGVATTFGAAGGLVVLLLWAHYSAQIFFLGAAFTAEWARSRGRPIEPTRHSIEVRVDHA